MIVADNPINNPESCFYKTKVGEAAVRAGAELMLPKDSYFEQLYVGGETITNTWRMFYRPFREATKVIGISPVKDHNLCKATVTMKNWYGLLGNPRNQFHQNIHGIISDFALMMKPTAGDRRRPQAPDAQRPDRRQPERRQAGRHDGRRHRPHRRR